MRAFRGIRAQLLGVLLIVLAPLAWLLFSTESQLRRVQTTAADAELRQGVSTAVRELQNEVAAVRQLAGALAVDTGLAFDLEACEARLQPVFDLNPIFNAMAVLDPTGTAKCGVPPVGQPVNAGDRDYFRAALASSLPVVGEPVQSRLTGRLVLPVAVRIADAGGDAAAVLVMTLDLRRFLDHVLELVRGTDIAVVTLWDRRGAAVLRDPPVPEGAPMVNPAEVLQAILHGEVDPDGGAVTARGVDGVQRLYAIQEVQIGEQLYYLSLGMPVQAVHGAADALFRRQLIIVAATVLVVSGLAIWLGQLLVRRPVHKLKRVAEAIEGGDLGRRVGRLNGAVELRDLGEALDAMAEGLHQRERARAEAQSALAEAHAVLEQRVDSRTAELQATSRDARQQAQLLQKAQAFEGGLARMLELAQASGGLREGLEVVAHAMPSVLGSYGGALYLFRASRNLLEEGARWGEGQGLPHDLGPDDCWGLRLGRPYLLEPGTGHARCRHLPAWAERCLCLPLLAQGQVLGLLVLLPTAEATLEQDRPQLEHAARSLALALSNLQLREALKEQSIRDPLTGLVNRRFADEMLLRETARAQRSREPLAVLMIDVDHFKRFNDSFGHKAGDAVLVQLGALLARRSRASDVAARFGGEEFLLILPGLGPPAALERAEELRVAAEAMEVELSGQRLPPVTLSIGLAVFPNPIERPDRLVAAADAALYAAKAAGRNRVSEASS